MRPGRLAVYSGSEDGKFILPRFVVVPDDGSEPIELRVSRASVSGKVGEAVTAVVRCYVTEIQLEDVHTGIRVTAKGRPVAVYPDVSITGDGNLVAVRSFLWRFRAGSFGRTVLERISFATKAAGS